MDRSIMDQVTDLVNRIRQGNVRALARAISLVENDDPCALQIVSECSAFSKSAMRIGVTGPPGAGKSTLVDQLTRRYRGRGLPVGVLATDPSSPMSGGALLGDRIRMREHSSDAEVYFRSMATRGSLGGVARAAAGVATVIAASGKERILLETVGVGQSEVEVAHIADVVIVVLVPGMGDDVQSMKAGIMEVADIFVVNKSDREGSDRLHQEILSMQSTGAGFADWVAPVMRTVATSGEGVAELDDAVEGFCSWLSHDERLSRRRANQLETRRQEVKYR